MIESSPEDDPANDDLISNVSAKFNTSGMNNRQIKSKMTYLNIYFQNQETIEINQSESLLPNYLVM